MGEKILKMGREGNGGENKRREILGGRNCTRMAGFLLSLSLSLSLWSQETPTLSLSFDQPADWLDCKGALEYNILSLH
jgi:hypothetical protein